MSIYVDGNELRSSCFFFKDISVVAVPIHSSQDCLQKIYNDEKEAREANSNNQFHVSYSDLCSKRLEAKRDIPAEMNLR